MVQPGRVSPFGELQKLTVELLESRGALREGEEKELADLQALKERVETAQRALRRQDVDEVLGAAGQTVAGWFGDIQKGTFLGIPLRVHRALAERLTGAQTALVDDPTVNPAGLNAAALGKRLGMYNSTSSLRKPALAVGGSSLSLHTFGLAVDLNYRGNPFLGNAGALAPWLALINKDHAALSAGGDFQNHKPPEKGFLDLDEAVVLALTDAGLTWGGTYARAKDIMHFDLRQAEGSKVHAARTAHNANR